VLQTVTVHRPVPQQTQHSRPRLTVQSESPGREQHEGALLSETVINQTRQAGRVMIQADGAKVYVHEVEPGRFNVVVWGERRLITTFERLSQKSLDRLGKNYGWK
jgi:hypothetical protein